MKNTRLSSRTLVEPGNQRFPMAKLTMRDLVKTYANGNQIPAFAGMTEND